VNDPAGRSRDPADLLESEAARRPRGDFIPPRLVRSSVRDPAAYAERAGIRSGESARVVLAVNVTEQGVAGDISVSATSGSAQADAAAIEYARTLRWAPAQDKGRESSASIRLPVVLALSN
jgi:TonB family protein